MSRGVLKEFRREPVAESNQQIKSSSVELTGNLAALGDDVRPLLT